MTLKDNFTLGVYGDGQLARLLALKARELNLKVLFYTLDKAHSPCKDLGELIEGKAWDDHESFLQFLTKTDVIVLENEFIPAAFLKEAELGGKKTVPDAKSYQAVSDKLKQVELAQSLGIRTPQYEVIRQPADCNRLIAPVMLKTLTGGYDGYGNLLCRRSGDFELAQNFIKKRGPALAQEFIAFDHEVAVLIYGDGKRYYSFPVVETVQEKNICHYVLTPPRLSQKIQDEVTNAATKIIKSLGAKGLFGVEFFIKDEEVIFNEIAPRPHNSGHYSIDACEMSQFLAILNLALDIELKKTGLISKAAGMLNLLGTHDGKAAFKGDEKFKTRGKLHLYGKEESRVGRKMGHFTVTGENSETLLSELKELRGKYEI